MDVFDENIIKHDQEEEETTSDCSLSEEKELLEDYGMRITEKEIETTREERIDKTVILKKLQNYFNLDSSDESSICLRCGSTFRSNQKFSLMIQHLNNCAQDQNFNIKNFLGNEAI